MSVSADETSLPIADCSCEIIRLVFSHSRKDSPALWERLFPQALMVAWVSERTSTATARVSQEHEGERSFCDGTGTSVSCLSVRRSACYD